MDEYMENQTVEEMQIDSVQDDAALDQAADDGAMALSEALSELSGGQEEAAESADDTAAEESAQTEAPVDKGFKGRLNQVERRGYERGKKEAQDAWQAERAEYEARLAKYAEMELKQEAAQLAKDEGISESIALRLLRAERGIPAPKEEALVKESSQPRGADGRFVAKQQEQSQPDAVHARAELLMGQAETIKKATGIDVLELFESDPEIKRKVASGEWDFTDVAAAQREQPRRRAPGVARTPNGASYNGKSIASMSSDEFRKLDDMLARGYTFDPSK